MQRANSFIMKKRTPHFHTIVSEFRMLKSYSAELSGSQLIWIDEPPKNLHRQPVLVVIENASPDAEPTKRYDLADLMGRLTWQGDAVAAQREQRDAW
jgi:hypothetical protein